MVSPGSYATVELPGNSYIHFPVCQVSERVYLDLHCVLSNRALYHAATTSCHFIIDLSLLSPFLLMIRRWHNIVYTCFWQMCVVCLQAPSFLV